MNENLSHELEALENGCGMALLLERAFLRVTGTDSTRWLNGMVTNSVTALQPSEGAYSFLLNAQGRIQGDCTVYREPEQEPASFLLSTTAAQIEVLEPWLDRYIIMDDVELTRALEEQTSLLLLGHGLAKALQSLALPTPGPLRLLRADTPDGPLLLTTSAPSTEPRQLPGVELCGPASLIEVVQHKLRQTGAVELSPQALEARRVREGTPLFGRDIRDRDLPQETGQAHALHFAKGCYLGQEIVERIRSRGQVHRTFTRFELTGHLPETFPAPLEIRTADAVKAVGELTSAAPIVRPDGASRLLALGYIRREFQAPGTTATYPGGTAVPLSRS